MSIKIIVSNTVGFKVKGTIKNEEGTDVPFDLFLKCDRLTADQITAKLKSSAETLYTDFMLDVVTDWSGVQDADGQPVAFSEAKFRELCQIPGLSALMYGTYANEVGAKAKN